METNQADVDGQRIRQMESNMVTITKELSEIKKLVSDITNTTPVTTPADNAESVHDRQKAVVPEGKPVHNIWHDTERLASVKAKPAESVLVIDKGVDSLTEKC